MLFTNTWAIKELILFPTLKRDKVEKEEEEDVEGDRGEIMNQVQDDSETASSTSSLRNDDSESVQARVRKTPDVSSVAMTRDEAFILLQKYMQSPNLIKHSLAAEAAMRGIYR